jgi:ubiquinone/menaquinone biosynthesis C-methylase UbiE
MSPPPDRVSGDAASFIGNIPEHYDTGLGPVIFVDYAADIARRTAACGPARVLETAAGTGIVTRQLRDVLHPGVHLTATDLNAPMLEVARTKFRPGEAVDFRPADAASLPFADGAFDAVVCQFGVMFFPQKETAFREAHRVLSQGGHYLFSGTRTGTTPSAESRMRRLRASFLPIRLSFTTCRSPITGSIPSRNR